ncbi:MAG: hypothetical protein PHW73_10285 [Atribacterota bacterium]|nr:hypothetical protein [Atribacterota bacterium]
MRWPRHTIQFLNYGYSQYIRKVLELSEIDPEKIEWRFYDNWTPYHPESGKNKLLSFKKDQCGSGQISSHRIS